MTQNLRAERLARCFQRFGIGAGHRDAGAFANELTRRLQPDAAGSAGDERTLACQPVHDLGSFSSVLVFGDHHSTGRGSNWYMCPIMPSGGSHSCHGAGSMNAK
jgi:hypothetical protein